MLSNVCSITGASNKGMLPIYEDNPSGDAPMRSSTQPTKRCRKESRDDIATPQKKRSRKGAEVKEAAESDDMQNLTAQVTKYTELREAELRKIDGDVRTEHGLDNTLAASVTESATFHEPADGAILTPDGHVKQELPDAESEDGDAHPTLRTRLVGIQSLQRQIASATSDTDGAPFTLCGLRALGTTPDIAALAVAEQNGIPKEEVAYQDFGQCLEQEYFYESGGVDYFRNAISAALTKSAKVASAFGTVNDPANAPTAKSPETSPMVVYASWRLDKLRRDAEDAAVDAAAATSDANDEDMPTLETRANAAAAARTRAIQGAERNLAFSQMLASKYWDSLGETKEITPEHIAFYLFEPCGRERTCIMGDRCVAYLMVYHPLHDTPPQQMATVTAGQAPFQPYTRRMGIVLKEFLTDTEREQFDRFGTLPEVHKPCILCMRCDVTYKYLLACLGIRRWASLYHYHPVNVPGGYRLAACLQPKKVSTKGACMPTRGFVTNDYVPTTLDEAVWAGAVPLTSTELQRLRAECQEFERTNGGDARLNGKCGLPRLRGFAERANVFEHQTTHELTPQSVALGTEPAITSVCALAACVTANVDPLKLGESEINTAAAASRGFALYPACLSVASPPPPPPPPSEGGKDRSGNGKKRTGDKISCCEQGEHAGRWRHLVIECSARLGISTETMDVVLGPFCELCVAVSMALERTESGAEAASELATVARGLRTWSRMPPPTPLSRHAVFVACVLRTELAEDMRRTVDMDAVEIARHKADARGATEEKNAVAVALQNTDVHKYDKWEALVAAADRATTDPQLLRALDGGRESWARQKQAFADTVAGDAKKKFEARLLPFPAVTRAQQAILARIGKIKDAAAVAAPSREHVALAALVVEKQKKRPSQKTLDRILQAVAEFDAAQRPLRRALLWARGASMPIDDAALLGVAPVAGGQRSVAYHRAMFGCVDPDARTPTLRVPRKPVKLTLPTSAPVAAKGAAVERYTRSGLPMRSRLFRPAPFLVPDVPLCKVRFPSHRQAVLAAAGARSDFLALASTSAVSMPTCEELLDEFWKAVAVVKRLGPDTEAALIKSFGAPFAVHGGSDRCSIVATALARVALGEHMEARAREAGDATLAYRAHGFVTTHWDLLTAVGWASADEWTDDALLRPGRAGGGSCIADATYPFDGRAFLEEDMVPIAAELTSCGFFDQASDPESSKTLEHVLKKLFPRACEKREAASIIGQTASTCPAFSVWFMGVLRCFLLGSYPHALSRPSLAVAASTCERFLREAQTDLERRIAEADRRPLAEKHERKARKMQAAVAMFGPHQFWGALEIIRTLEVAGRCIRELVDGEFSAEPCFAAAQLGRRALVEAVATEAARRLSPEQAALVRRKDFMDAFEARVDALAIYDGSIRDFVCTCLAPGDDRGAVGAVAAAINVAIEILGKGGLSSPHTHIAHVAAAAIATDVCTAVRAVYTSACREVHVTTAFRDPEPFFAALLANIETSLLALRRAGRSSDALKAVAGGDGAAIDDIRAWPLSAESVIEVCAVTSSHVFSACIRAEGAAFMEKVARSHVGGITDVLGRKLVDAAMRAVAATDGGLIGGLADRVSVALAVRAGDVVDVWDPVVKACAEPRNRLAVSEVSHMLRAAATAARLVPHVPNDALSELIMTELEPAARSRRRLATLCTKPPATVSNLATGILETIAVLRGTEAGWDGNEGKCGAVADVAPPPPPPSVTPDYVSRVMLLAGRLMAELVRHAGTIATRAAAYADSRTKCELLRRNWELHCRVRMQLVDTALAYYADPHVCHGTTQRNRENPCQTCTALVDTAKASAGALPAKRESLRREWERHSRVCPALVVAASFVVRHATLCQFAIREVLVAQMSRNPALVAAFVTRGAWFPEFMDHVIRVCDDVRRCIDTSRAIPSEAMVVRAAEASAHGTWWAGKVYRLQKYDFAHRMNKTNEQHEGVISVLGLRVGPLFHVGADRIVLMREHVYALTAANGADRRSNLKRDLEVLWRFGMREHGLAIVVRLHAAYDRFGGKNEFYRAVGQFSCSEFLLEMEYYRALVTANSVLVIPLLSPSLSESTAAALRERHDLGDGDIPKQLLELTLCDICFSILTQMVARTSTRASKLTSCHAVVSGPNGELVCLDKRNSVKKKTSVKRRSAAGPSGDGAAKEDTDEDRAVATEAEEEEGEKEKHTEDAEATADHACQRCRTRRGMSASERLTLRMPMKCQETRVREVAGAGCVVEFSQKYTTKGEKSADSRLPVILTPCCGTWHRFSFDDWGPDGYRCRACSFARWTGPALPSTCAVCGCENKSPTTTGNASKKAETAKQLTTMSISAHAASPSATWVAQDVKWVPRYAARNDPPTRKKRKTICIDAAHGAPHRRFRRGPSARRRRARTGDTDEVESDAAAEAEEESVAEDTEASGADDTGDPAENEDAQLGDTIFVRSKKKRKTYEWLCHTVGGMDGLLIPTAADGQNVISVVDDDDTSMILPMTVCPTCFFAAMRISRTAPPLLSQLRIAVKRHLEEIQEKRAMQRASGTTYVSRKK